MSRALRRALAEYFPTSQEARALCGEAQMETGRISFEGVGMLVVWANVLREAGLVHKIDTLRALANARHPEVPEFQPPAAPREPALPQLSVMPQLEAPEPEPDDGTPFSHSVATFVEDAAVAPPPTEDVALPPIKLVNLRSSLIQDVDTTVLLLSEADVERIGELAIAAGVWSSRSALIAGMTDETRSLLSVAQIPAVQLIRDLQALNKLGVDQYKELPLALWLGAAARLSRSSGDASLEFRHYKELALESCRTNAAHRDEYRMNLLSRYLKPMATLRRFLEDSGIDTTRVPMSECSVRTAVVGMLNILEDVDNEARGEQETALCRLLLEYETIWEYGS
jgi:hypothetical protein